MTRTPAEIREELIEAKSCVATLEEELVVAIAAEPPVEFDAVITHKNGNGDGRVTHLTLAVGAPQGSVDLRDFGGSVRVTLRRRVGP